MDYFAGLDISMDETHVCVLDREGEVVRESKTVSTAQAIADELAKAPSCRRIVFETGRMAPILFHGFTQLGLTSGEYRWVEDHGLPIRLDVTVAVAELTDRSSLSSSRRPDKPTFWSVRSRLVA